MATTEEAQRAHQTLQEVPISTVLKNWTIPWHCLCQEVRYLYFHLQRSEIRRLLMRLAHQRGCLQRQPRPKMRHKAGVSLTYAKRNLWQMTLSQRIVLPRYGTRLNRLYPKASLQTQTLSGRILSQKLGIYNLI